MVGTRMVALALLATTHEFVTNVPENYPEKRFAIFLLLSWAGSSVVSSAYGVPLSFLGASFHRFGEKERGSLPSPLWPDVGQLVSGEKRPPIFPVKGISAKNVVSKL